MTYAQRTRRAIEHLRELKDQGREEREWAEQERAQQAIDDRAENARRAEEHPLLRSESPGVLRAQASVRAILRARDEAMSDEDELAASPFGSGQGDDDDGRDDEDDYLDD